MSFVRLAPRALGNELERTDEWNNERTSDRVRVHLRAWLSNGAIEQGSRSWIVTRRSFQLVSTRHRFTLLRSFLPRRIFRANFHLVISTLRILTRFTRNFKIQNCIECAWCIKKECKQKCDIYVVYKSIYIYYKVATERLNDIKKK